MQIKPQDTLFVIVLLLLLLRRDPKLFVWAGIISLLISMPLFYKWIFFTAERLVVYAFVFILVATLLNLIHLRHNK